MPDREAVKQFLRIDFDDDDDYIDLLITAAKEYIADALGGYQDDSARCKLLLYNFVATMYENRQFTIEKPDRMPYPLKTMILQMQLEEDNESGTAES